GRLRGTSCRAGRQYRRTGGAAADLACTPARNTAVRRRALCTRHGTTAAPGLAGNRAAASARQAPGSNLKGRRLPAIVAGLVVEIPDDGSGDAEAFAAGRDARAAVTRHETL